MCHNSPTQCFLSLFLCKINHIAQTFIWLDQCYIQFTAIFPFFQAFAHKPNRNNVLKALFDQQADGKIVNNSAI